MRVFIVINWAWIFSPLIVISSEFEELLAMSDRVLIIHDGRIVNELNRREIESEEVLHHAVQG